MASCFGKRRKGSNKSSSFSCTSVYPPPIRIQKSLVIPGFIREARQLSRTLSLRLVAQDSISLSNSETSLENEFEKLTTNSDLLKTKLSSNIYYQDLNQGNYYESKPSLKYEEINSNLSNHYYEWPRNNSIQKMKSKTINEQTGNNIIVNPVNIKPREIKKVDSNQFRDKLSNKSDNTSKSSDLHLQDHSFNDYNTSNEYIQNNIVKQKSTNLQNDFELYSGNKSTELINVDVTPNIAHRNEELYSNNPINRVVDNMMSKKIPESRKRILSAPNNTTILIDQTLNDELKDKKVIKNTKNRHRTSSLRILAQSVINLLNKRGSKGRGEKQEVQSINKLLNDLEIQSSNQSENSLTKSSNSTISSNSPSFINQDTNSVNELIKKMSSSKKQVSFEMDLKKPERKESSKISKRFSNLLGRGKSSKTNSQVEFSRKGSKSKLDQTKNDIMESNYNNNTIFLDNSIFTVNNKELKHIQEFNIPISLTRTESSETLNSDFSLEQRVARTYDMQILTYDQSPIPIPNLPRGRKLQSLENLENCFLVFNPKLPNILSLCYRG